MTNDILNFGINKGIKHKYHTKYWEVQTLLNVTNEYVIKNRPFYDQDSINYTRLDKKANFCYLHNSKCLFKKIENTIISENCGKKLNSLNNSELFHVTSVK